MTTLVVVGAQWGDEGKGKVVDYLANEADLVARFSGGNNAGHTLVIGDRKIITHLVPSGCTYAGTRCLLGAGMVVDLEVFADEIKALQEQGLLANNELGVSYDAHVILPHHRLLDGLREDRALRGQEIGTTRRGIGPAYEAKAGRRGVRVRDLFNPERLRSRLQANHRVINAELASLGSPETLEIEKLVADAERWAAWIKPMVCDAGEEVVTAVRAKKSVLIEGAQGALLDLDHGTYPFVTSTSTVAGAACIGLGIGPTLIDKVVGITKAYATRVGAGPFPTRLEGPEGDRLRTVGAEFGATTGRPRDCGWLDLPALKYAARINGLTGLCVTKLDVTAALPQLKVCVRYSDGRVPGIDELGEVEPEYEQIENWGDPSWLDKVRSARTLGDLPTAIRKYLDLIAEVVNVPVMLVSVGPDREQTIIVDRAF